MAQPAFDHALGRRAVVFLQQIFFQRPGVDADANRNFALGRGVDHFFDIFARADVAGIETQTIDALLDGD